MNGLKIFKRVANFSNCNSNLINCLHLTKTLAVVART